MGGTVSTMAGAAMFGGSGASSGTYSILLMLTGQLYWPLTELGNVANELQRALVSLDRVYDLLEEKVEERSGTRPLDPRQVGGEILVDNVVFGYQPDTPVLRGVNLRFAAGRTTAIVGPTGSGKSTLAKLLMRFHEAGEGAVLLDGEDIRNFVVRDLRRTIALVSQTTFLFYGSVRENIALADPTAPLAEVRQAAGWARASRFIEALPQGYESQVEEYGQKLSGGERQRIALARALIRDAPILLLDEATSQVDNNTEAAILASLREIRKGRTTIVIAHRLSAVRDADAIYVLDHGQVVEEGSHDELVRLGGTYAALWHLQSGPPHSPPPDRPEPPGADGEP
jgi:ATP-binding cassette subfamily B protein